VVGGQAALASKPAPTFLDRGVSGREGWLSGRLRGRARSHIFGSRGDRQMVVDGQAAFAGKPAPTFLDRGVTGSRRGNGRALIAH